MEKNRVFWEMKAAASRLGFRDVESMIAERRREDRRKRDCEDFEREERRESDRRAADRLADREAVAAWLARFEAAKASANG